ncbi:unnamed protein product [Prorocentrum cordatum]|uniref:Uncharacterized protein n=1 Tax=Prorocentrum cordatum TaxID=2364126 RepID=A0ABN9SV67_9DINO|nr:unnamed protein product [Polarella glacialis]
MGRGRTARRDWEESEDREKGEGGTRTRRGRSSGMSWSACSRGCNEPRPAQRAQGWVRFLPLPRTQPAATVEIHRRIRHTFKNYMNCTCVKNDANRRRYVDAAACQSLLGKNAMGQTSPYILDSPNL